MGLFLHVFACRNHRELQRASVSQERTSSWGTYIRVKCQLQRAASICHTISRLRGECQGTSVARSPCLSRNGSGRKVSLRSVCILNAVQPLLLEDTEEIESVGEGETPTIRAKGKTKKNTPHTHSQKREKSPSCGPVVLHKSGMCLWMGMAHNSRQADIKSVCVETCPRTVMDYLALIPSQPGLAWLSPPTPTVWNVTR